jgi:hypothetical protein
MDNRELIKELLKLSDEALKHMHRPGMAGEGRKVAEHYANGGLVYLFDTASRWVDCCLPSFRSVPERYRIKQKKIKVNDVEVPAPESEPVHFGQEYYVASPAEGDGYVRYAWAHDESDHLFLEHGLIHLVKENAIQHTEAMLKREEVE